MRVRSAHLAIPGLVWITCFLLLPLGATLFMSLLKSDAGVITHQFTFDNFVRIAVQPVYRALLLKSLRITLVVTALTIAIAYPVAYWIASLPARRKARALILVLVPFWISYVVRTYAWFPLLGTGGIINSALLRLGLIDAPLQVLLFNEFSVHLGLLYVYLPYAVIPITLSIDRIDRSLIEAASDLGGTTAQTFWKVIIPLSMPGVIAALIMVFVLCFGAYVTPALLGGASGIMIGRVIPELLGVGMNWPLGAALSAAMILFSLLWIVLVGRRIGLDRVFLGSR